MIDGHLVSMIAHHRFLTVNIHIMMMIMIILMCFLSILINLYDTYHADHAMDAQMNTDDELN